MKLFALLYDMLRLIYCIIRISGSKFMYYIKKIDDFVDRIDDKPKNKK